MLIKEILQLYESEFNTNRLMPVLRNYEVLKNEGGLISLYVYNADNFFDNDLMGAFPTLQFDVIQFSGALAITQNTINIQKQVRNVDVRNRALHIVIKEYNLELISKLDLNFINYTHIDLDIQVFEDDFDVRKLTILEHLSKRFGEVSVQVDMFSKKFTISNLDSIKLLKQKKINLSYIFGFHLPETGRTYYIDEELPHKLKTTNEALGKYQDDSNINQFIDTLIDNGAEDWL